MTPDGEQDFEQRVEEENYFVSMTDMMVGLVFIFIILLMYYALQLRQAQEIFHSTTQQISSADQTRADILKDVQARLRQKGLRVTIDLQNGVLRLPDEILFDSGKAEIKPDGVIALRILGEALEQVLPCYTNHTGATLISCNRPSVHHVESLFIEGHTDKDVLKGGGYLKDNWDLSVARATNTYRELTALYPGLTGLCLHKGGQCVPILSVSGYGAERPISLGDDDASKAKNRRIDLRILMEAPNASSVQKDLNKKMGVQL